MTDVRKNEPRLALEAGPAGLDVIAQLLPQVPNSLIPGGAVILEIAYDQGESVLDLIQQMLPEAFDVELHKDYQGHPRMVTFNL